MFAAVDSDTLEGFMEQLAASAAKLEELLGVYDSIDNSLPGAPADRLITVVQNSVQLASAIKGGTHLALATMGKWLDRCARFSTWSPLGGMLCMQVWGLQLAELYCLQDAPWPGL
jgi:hypothetical protein